MSAVSIHRHRRLRRIDFICLEPLQFTWSPDGSQPPYYISLIPGSIFPATFFTLIFTLTNSDQRVSQQQMLQVVLCSFLSFIREFMCLLVVA